MTEEKPPSRVLRQRFEQEYVLPLARAMFELEPRCHSVLVTIGQYWCDEATDAVHCETIACPERDPIWPLAGQARPEAIGDPAEVLAAAERDGDGPADLLDVQYGLHQAASKQAFGQEYFCFLDDNTDMIVAFASYCREVSDQEQPRWRSHTPYGVVRRPLDGASLTFEVLAPMYRPEWEDRWDVLEKDGIISGQDDDRSPALAASGAPSSNASAVRIPPRAPGKPVALLRPTYQVLLFLLLVAAVVTVRGCLQQ